MMRLHVQSLQDRLRGFLLLIATDKALNIPICEKLVLIETSERKKTTNKRVKCWALLPGQYHSRPPKPNSLFILKKGTHFHGIKDPITFFGKYCDFHCRG